MMQGGITVLMQGQECSARVSRSKSVRVVSQPRIEVARQARDILVLATASGLGRVARFVREAGRLHQIGRASCRERVCHRV